jgi:uncharacterized protein
MKVAPALYVALSTTLIVGLLAHLLPADYAATGIGLCFCGVCYFMVLRHDSNTIRDTGLSLGGLLLPEPFDGHAFGRATLNAVKWCGLSAAIWFPPFVIGYLLWWRPTTVFHLRFGEAPVDEIAAQVLAVALPEEMFYRGYLQSKLDEVWPPKQRILGTLVGPGLLVTSAIFAAGHLVTTPHPARLAVFFPSLMFGWLRARTGGVGAGILFHAACNLLTVYLGRGYDFFL